VAAGKEAAVGRTRAVAVAEVAPAAGGREGILGLRDRLGEPTERDAVVIDFLEDDLHEARSALSAVDRYLDEVEATLGDGGGGRDEVLALALGRGPFERIEYLAGVVGNLRRRLAQVSSRLAP
jgi:hypothetical protein